MCLANSSSMCHFSQNITTLCSLWLFPQFCNIFYVIFHVNVLYNFYHFLLFHIFNLFLSLSSLLIVLILLLLLPLLFLILMLLPFPPFALLFFCLIFIVSVFLVHYLFLSLHNHVSIILFHLLFHSTPLHSIYYPCSNTNVVHCVIFKYTYPTRYTSPHTHIQPFNIPHTHPTHTQT